MTSWNASTQSCKRRLLRAAATLTSCSLLAPAGGIWAQQQEQCGERALLRVMVVDQSGTIPLPGAVVVVRWSELVEMPVRQAAGVDGRFSLCVPEDAREATLWAEFGDDSSQQAIATFEAGATREVVLRVLSEGMRSGRLLGQVLDALTDDPVRTAAASLRGRPLVVDTNRQGRFVLTGVPAGVHELEVRRIGYAPLRHPITIDRGLTTEGPRAVGHGADRSHSHQNTSDGDRGVLRPQALGRTDRVGLLHHGRRNRPLASKQCEWFRRHDGTGNVGVGEPADVDGILGSAMPDETISRRYFAQRQWDRSIRTSVRSRRDRGVQGPSVAAGRVRRLRCPLRGCRSLDQVGGRAPRSPPFAALPNRRTTRRWRASSSGSRWRTGLWSSTAGSLEELAAIARNRISNVTCSRCSAGHRRRSRHSTGAHPPRTARSLIDGVTNVITFRTQFIDFGPSTDLPLARPSKRALDPLRGDGCSEDA